MAEYMQPDFSGWATRYNVRCGDGRTIRKNAFAAQNGAKVPLVWQHVHDKIDNVLGHAVLESRNEGLYAYCYLNNDVEGQKAWERVSHGDLDSLSIWANDLVEDAYRNVSHGTIRELSLVLSGANPEASIENVAVHSFNGQDYEPDENADTAFICSGEPIFLAHSDDLDGGDDMDEYYEEDYEEYDDYEDGDEIDLEEEFESLTDRQKAAMYEIVGGIMADQAEKMEHSGLYGGEAMNYNVFDVQSGDDVISHAEQGEIIGDAMRGGSMREAALSHGITDIEWLFPEAHNMNVTPEWIQRDQGWVSIVMNGTHHVPFSRIKSQFADITQDSARALGYIKGNLKKEQVFSLLRRTTTPQTIYKKQKLDRDDIIDITDFDVVSWIKAEMRQQLNEEIARAILVGDGRETTSEDKIRPDNIRPIAFDAELYTINAYVDLTSATLPQNFIKTAVRSRKNYKGSGSPTLFTTEDMLIEMRLIEDLNQRVIYESDDKLSSALRVSKIQTVPIMDDVTNADGNKLLGIIVNLSDYAVGADKGGAVNMFEDFDINYNKEIYLIETRCSGALTKPYSAIAIWGTTSSSQTTL